MSQGAAAAADQGGGGCEGRQDRGRHAPPHAPPHAPVPTHASATRTCPMWQKVLQEMERDGIVLQVLHA